MRIIFFLSLLVCTCTVLAQKKIIFQDDFDQLDTSIWSHEITMGGGGNWEFEYYTNNRSNSFVRDGVLFIKPTLTSDTIGEANVRGGYTMDVWGSTPADQCTGNAFYGCERTSGAGGNIINPVQSAAIRTTNSFSFKYGQVEVRAKLPRGDWIWPAIWFLPRYNQYGEWPASGEIDLMESRGNDASYPGGGINQFGSTLHFGPHWPEDAFIKTHETYTLPSGTFADDFHIFGMIWNENGITTYIDNTTNVVLKVDFTNQTNWQRGGYDKTHYDNPWAGRPNAAPFDQQYYVVFNVAVGGSTDYFPDGMGGKPWSNASPHTVDDFYNAKGQWYPTWKGDSVAMQIDYIKVWQ